MAPEASSLRQSHLARALGTYSQGSLEHSTMCSSMVLMATSRGWAGGAGARHGSAVGHPGPALPAAARLQERLQTILFFSPFAQLLQEL